MKVPMTCTGIYVLRGRVTLAVTLAALLLAACGGGSDSGSTPVRISSAPSSTIGRLGGSATFSVDATGSNLVFQWQRSVDKQVTWVDISGATAAAYVIALIDAALDGNWYRAVVSNDTGSVPTTPAQLTVAAAHLKPRLGSSAYYCPELDATIISNANLPASLSLGVPGISASGTMTWPTARAWIQALNSSAYLGQSDWRLPTVAPINGSSFQFNNVPGDTHGGYSGRIDLGYNISAPGTQYAGSHASELPYLFYNVLYDIAKFSATGSAQDNTLNAYSPFNKVNPGPYWTGQPYGADGAMAFDMLNGTQYAYATNWQFNVIAVRSGDVGTP
jgi:hypothetical protein